MPDSHNNGVGVDPFTGFWTDMMGKMASAGVAAPPTSPDMMAGMRKAFFGAMTEYADDFMRSEQFLTAMKKSMDSSLALRQQINQFLTSGLQSAQMPTRSDTDHIVLLVRGLEDRIVGKLDALSERVEQLETQQNGSARKTATVTKPQPQPKKKGRR